MEERKMMAPINNFEEKEDVNEEQNNFIACGTDDYCDSCVGICKPQYH